MGAVPEEWRRIAGFPAWEVSDRGHVRRRPRGGRRTGRLLAYKVLPDGALSVILTRGPKARELLVDILVCRAFQGPMPGKDMMPQHIDGIIWNNWASNLRWEYKIVATEWYCGPIGPAQRGHFAFGPFADKTELLPHVKYGHVILARDQGKVVAFEFVLGRDFSKDIRDPYDLSRYWRATVNSLTEIERCKGADMPKFNPKDPQAVYDAVLRYRELASMHSDWMWAQYLLEASYFIERMANMVYHDIQPPEIKPAPPERRRISAPPPPAAPVIERRRVVRRPVTDLFE